MTESTRHTQLLDTLGPLPIRGRSWPLPIAIAAWLIILIIGSRLLYIASTQAEHIASALMLSIGIAYVGMMVVAYFMLIGHTTISAQGIEQRWITKRQLAWQDLKFAKFVPLFFSKRLICFTARGFPVVFQGASTELEIAFAHISLIYKSPPKNEV